MSQAIATVCKTHIGLASLYLNIGETALAHEQVILAETLVPAIDPPAAFLSCHLHVKALKRSVLWLPNWDKGLDDVAA